MSIFTFNKNFKYFSFLFILLFVFGVSAQEKPDEKAKEVKKKERKLPQSKLKKKADCLLSLFRV